MKGKKRISTAKVAAVCLGLVMIFGMAGLASAANPHETPINPNPTGQPSQSCQAEPLSPGNAASAPGSAFNPAGVAGSVYAGNNQFAPGFANDHANDKAIAQYDVACFEVSQKLLSPNIDLGSFSLPPLDMGPI